MARVVDLSHEIKADIPMFPGHPQPVVEEFLNREVSKWTYAAGTSFVIHRYAFVGNTGTYLDSPFHRYEDGDDLSILDLDATVDIPGVVIDAREQVAAGQMRIEADAFSGVDVVGRAVLVATGWDRLWSTPAYLDVKPYLVAAGAECLHDGGARLVGIDTWNIDDVADQVRPAHSVLLRAGIPIVENVRGLDQLIGLSFRFFAPPLPIRGGSAIPVRAFALADS